MGTVYKETGRECTGGFIWKIEGSGYLGNTFKVNEGFLEEESILHICLR